MTSCQPSGPIHLLAFEPFSRHDGLKSIQVRLRTGCMNADQPGEFYNLSARLRAFGLGGCAISTCATSDSCKNSNHQ